MDNKSLTFLYPSRTVGGAQFLFLRMAQELASRDGLDVQYIDYAHDGFAASQIDPDGPVNILPYQIGAMDLRDTTVVISTYHLPFVTTMLGPDALDPARNLTFLIWTIHPENASIALNGGGRRYLGNMTKRKAIFQELADRGHIVFMDGANVAAFAQTVGPVTNARLLPVPVQIDPLPTRLRDDDGVFRIAWLGRLSEDKVASVEKLVDDVAGIALGRPVELLIIGDGPQKERVATYAKSKKLSVEMPGVILNDALQLTLRHMVDLGVAMGTSCLEFGRLGIPAALIDYSHVRLPDDARYDWIFETEDFDLGREATLGRPRRWLLSDLCAACQTQSDLGGKCYDYISKNHNIAVVADQLIMHVDRISSCGEATMTSQQATTLLPAYYRWGFGAARSSYRWSKTLKGRLSRIKF